MLRHSLLSGVSHQGGLRRRVARALVVAAVACLGIVLRPAPAHACIWNFLHWFNPLPPCEVQDDPARWRMHQTNNRILGKLGTIASDVIEIKAEIEGWKAASRTARRFSDQLARTYGDLSANPLPSLAAAYNRTPMANFLQLNANGTFSVGVDPINFRRVADSVWTTYQDSLGLKRIYRKDWEDPARLPKQIFGSGARLEQQIAALGDWETFTRPILDSLSMLGGRTASRYMAHAEVAGLSEARISNLAIALSKLRGTAFEAQGLGLSAKIQALTAATEKQRQLQRLHTTTGTPLQW